MDPPSYSEATLHPPALGAIATIYTPTPAYDNAMATPSTPPPTYEVAVTPGNPYLVLTPPTLRADVIVHQTTHIGVRDRVHSGTVVMDQSELPVAFGRSPCVTRCPHCHRVVTTTVKRAPGDRAWCMCILLALMGLVGGCCLIPFMVPGCWDVHHSCPHCHLLITSLPP